MIVTRERSAPLSGTVARTSAGAVSRLQISQVVNLAEALKSVRAKGFWVFGAVPDRAALSVYAADFRIPVCLVIGSEGKGIRPLVQKQCDHLITIPMQGISIRSTSRLRRQLSCLRLAVSRGPQAERAGALRFRCVISCADLRKCKFIGTDIGIAIGIES